MSTVSIEVSASTLDVAKRLSSETSQPIDKVLADALDDFADRQRRLAEFEARAERGRRVDIRAILAKSPAVPPVPGDELD
jgi:predicted transcriptional regulator